METIILAVHILVALGLIGLVLLQQGKGAEAGASFGAGASQTVFGSSGAGSFLARVTAVLAAIFFATSVALAILARGGMSVSPSIGVPDAIETISVPAEAGSPSEKEEAVSDVPQVDSLPVDSSAESVIDSGSPARE
ncbi:MAG: preprotein translocase subunit SecG [Kistimonas sp.]|nr:preprotein translocase subunit SecG [Kistimonas sp.]